MDFMNGLAVYYAWKTLHRLDALDGGKPYQIELEDRLVPYQPGRLRRSVSRLAKLVACYS